MDKGKEFEEITAELYEKAGWRTETRKTMKGRSGAVHQIDVYGEKGKVRKKRFFAECKFRETSDKVRKSHLANFLLKLDDIDMKVDAYIVTNSDFSSYAIQTAEVYDIKLVDRTQLYRLLNKYGMQRQLEFIEAYQQSPLSKAVIETIDILGELGILK